MKNNASFEQIYEHISAKLNSSQPLSEEDLCFLLIASLYKEEFNVEE